MLFSNAARRIAGSSIRSAGVRCLTTSTKSVPRGAKAAMPILLAGGLTALGLTQYNNNVQCGAPTSKLEEAVKAVEDKFVTYWPRNIMVCDYLIPHHFCALKNVIR
jgi:hypothetical protein